MRQAIDFSKLPAPDVVQPIDPMALLDDLLDDFTMQMQAVDAAYTRPLPSDPVYINLTTVSYRIARHQQQTNEAAQAVMPAYAVATDLDHIASFYGVTRLVIDTGDTEAIPPIPPTYESDAGLRARMLLAPEGYTNAGSEGAYSFHALSADGKVKAASVISSQPCYITITVLSHDGNGTPTDDLLGQVESALSDRYVRPLGDRVTVNAAQIVPYTVDARLSYLDGPDAAVVRANAQAAIEQYVIDQHGLGHDVTQSGIHAALHQPGIHNVEVITPTENLWLNADQAAYCTSITLTDVG